MGDLTRYQMFCENEEIVVLTDYVSDYPTRCPNNVEHKIDTSTIEIYHKISTKTVKINQNSGIEIGGYYRADQYEMEIGPNKDEWTKFEVKYPYNISVHTINFLVSQENVGDRYEVISYPETTVGYITSELLRGQNELAINSTLPLNNGFRLTISSEDGTEDLGEIINIDRINNKVYFTQGSTQNFREQSLVKISVPRITNGKFVNTENIILGMSQISSSELEAEKIVRFLYKNTTESPKTLNFIVELQY